MSKQKHKVARYQVALNDPQNKMLEEMMKEDAQTEISGFFGVILVNEYKRRQEVKNKRPQGRPRKEDDDNANDVFVDEPLDWSDDLPKTINWYGKKIGPKESAHYDNLQKAFQPK